jgi:hypothetical protein
LIFLIYDTFLKISARFYWATAKSKLSISVCSTSAVSLGAGKNTGTKAPVDELGTKT